MTHAPTSLAIYLLGPPRLERNGQLVEVDTRKAIALLAYLALHPERFSRDRLATFLWPEYDQERAYANLRRTLWALNKAVGEGWIVADHEVIGLGSRAGCWVDVVHFHQYVTQCRAHGHARTEVCAACLEPLTKAAALVRGNFLEGFSLRDSIEFDDWQALQSSTLRQEVSTILERLVLGLNGAGDHEGALAYAQRWVALDALHEPAQRQLMLTYAWAGQPAAALQQYRQCEQVLAAEMGVPPESETTQLVEAIRTRRTPQPPLRADLQAYRRLEGEPLAPTGPPTLSPTLQPTVQVESGVDPTPVIFHNIPPQSTSFVGRQAEVAEIVRLLQDEAECRLLTLLGPGGIGKTRLAIQTAQTILDCELRIANFEQDNAKPSANPKLVLEGSKIPQRRLLCCVGRY